MHTATPRALCNVPGQAPETGYMDTIKNGLKRMKFQGAIAIKITIKGAEIPYTLPFSLSFNDVCNVDCHSEDLDCNRDKREKGRTSTCRKDSPKGTRRMRRNGTMEALAHGGRWRRDGIDAEFEQLMHRVRREESSGALVAFVSAFLRAFFTPSWPRTCAVWTAILVVWGNFSCQVSPALPYTRREMAEMLLCTDKVRCGHNGAQALTDIKDDIAKIWKPLPKKVGNFLEMVQNVTRDVPAAVVITATTLVVRSFRGIA